MPHGWSSCRRRVPTLIRIELDVLYSRRLKLIEQINELERGMADPCQGASFQSGSLEILPNPCNLTTCRNA